MAITANLSYQPGASMARKDIQTASIYPLLEEWEHFQCVAASESRREAAQLVAQAGPTRQIPAHLVGGPGQAAAENDPVIHKAPAPAPRFHRRALHCLGAAFLGRQQAHGVEADKQLRGAQPHE